MAFKKVTNSDAGTADLFGGNDLDKIADALNGVDVSDPMKFNTDINTLYATTNAAGDILKSNGTKFVRLPRGSANQVLTVNAGGTDLAWGTPAGGGNVSTTSSNTYGDFDQIFRSGRLDVRNPANTFSYNITGSAIAADRTWTLPLLTANDIAVAEAFIQTLTNKTINATNNTITDTSTAAGDLLKSDGTKFVRLARGSANQVLGVNAGGTDVAWTAAPGGGATALDGLSDVAITSAARGDIIVRDATQYINKAKGTANQVLAMDGTGTDPVWTTPAAGGANIQPNSYFVYKDPADSLYKARKGSTAAVLATTSASNVTAVLDAIIADISPAGAPSVIELSAGDFDMTTVFDNFVAANLGNLTIKGQGMGVTNLVVTSSITASAHVLNIQGGTTGSQTNLTANALVSAPTLTVTSAAALAAGDYVLIRSTKDWTAASSGQVKQGEIRRIISIATNTLRFDKWIQDTYNTADTSNVIKINMLRNITLEGFTIKAGSGYTGTNVFVFCGYIDNLTIRDVETLDYRQAFEGSILIRSCHNVVADVIVHQSYNNTFNNQYGICIGNACEHVKVDVQAKGKWRHGQTIDSTSAAGWEGPSRSVVISGTSEATDESHFDSHADGEDITFLGCSVNSERTDTSNFDAKAIQVRTRKTSIVGCDFSNCIGECLSIEEDASGCIITGNRISDTRETDTASTGYGLDIRTGVNNVTITGNTFSSNKRQAIRLLTTSSGHVITGNQIINQTGSPGIDATDVTDVVVSGNRITGNSKAINMTGTCDWWVINGNSMRGNSGASTIIGANTVNTNNTT